MADDSDNFWWLYLDESGDLGFDFVNGKPSRFFTICILATSSRKTVAAFRHAARRVLRNKLNPRGKRRRMAEEIKATSTTLAIKQYAWSLIRQERFGIYCLTLNKKKLYARLAANKDRTYNYIARLVIDEIPLGQARGAVQLIVDRSKGKRQQLQFNEYIRRQLEGRIDPTLSLDITHGDSRDWPGLQFADLFAWGVFNKYERRDETWFDVFREKVRWDRLFL